MGESRCDRSGSWFGIKPSGFSHEHSKRRRKGPQFHVSMADSRAWKVVLSALVLQNSLSAAEDRYHSHYTIRVSQRPTFTEDYNHNDSLVFIWVSRYQVPYYTGTQKGTIILTTTPLWGTWLDPLGTLMAPKRLPTLQSRI